MGVRIKEENGCWWILINHKGKRKSRRIGPGEAGKRAAKEVAAKVHAKLVLGDLSVLETAPMPGMGSPTFAQIALEWKALASPAWKHGTRTTYESLIRHRLLPEFGPLPIQKVTAERVEAWWSRARAERKKGDIPLAKCHLQMLRALLRGILQRAVIRGLLAKNPADRIEARLGREDREIRKADYLTREDLTIFLAAAERIVPPEYPILLVMATCGLRIGEAVSLQVGDLDVQGLKLHVRRTRSTHGVLSSPKSGKGRVVDVPPSTMAVLAQVRETRQAEAAYTGREARWLFPGKDGQSPIAPELVERALRRALRAAGIRRIRPHDLRHTYATLAIQAGVPLLTVSRQLGHASISTTADIYAHAVPGSNRAAAAAMEAILSGLEPAAEGLDVKSEVGTRQDERGIA